MSVTATPAFEPEGANAVERQFVTLGPRQVHLRRCGSGPAAVLLPPLPYSGALFAPLLERLGGRFTALAPDPAGYGESAPLLVRDPSAEDYAADVLAVLDAVGATRFGLYGVQFGAVVALTIAAAAPARVTSLVVRDLPVLNEEERAAFRAVHGTPIRTRLDGGHLLEHFRLRRDEHVFFPPGTTDPACALPIDLQRPEVIATRVHRGVVEQMRAAPDHTVGYAAMLAADVSRALTDARVGVTVLSTPDDLLPGGRDRLPQDGAGVHLEESGDEAAALDRLLGRAEQVVPAAARPAPVRRSIWKDYAATPVGQVLVRRAGPDDGVPLVLFHASPGSGRTLEPLLEALAPDRPLYAVDTLGVGGSARPKILRTPEISDYARAVLAALDDLGLGIVDLYGTHTGSLLALETAVLLGDRVRSVVLNGVPLFSPDERAVFLQRHFVDLTPRWDGAELVMAWGHVRDLHHWFPWFDRRPERVAPRAPADADSLQAYLVDLLASGPSYVDPYRAVFLHDTRSRLPELQARTLVCHVSGDPLARFTDEAACLARAESITVDGPLGPAVASYLDGNAA